MFLLKVITSNVLRYTGHNFFSLIHLFKHTLCNNIKQAVGPGVLQTFSTCAVQVVVYQKKRDGA